jgi:uncharacterized protein (TIRG00374 family)
MVFAGIIVSVLCLWLAMRPILNDPEGLQRLEQACLNADYSTLPILLGMLGVFFLMKAWRWRLLLLPVASYRSLQDLFPPTLIGFAFNNVLPARMGEFVRCYVFARQQKTSMTMAVSSIFLERVFDVVAILMYLGCGLLLMPLPPDTQNLAIVFGAGIACVALGGILFVFWTRPLVDLTEWLLQRLRFVPDTMIKLICKLLEAAAQGMGSIKQPRLLSGILLLSLAKWALNGAMMLVSLWAFDLHPPPMAAFVLLGVVALGVSAPTTPGYFGVIQACFMAVLSGLNYPQESVFAASVYYHMSNYIPVTLLGLIFFGRTGLSLHEVTAAREEELEAAESADQLPPS